jgi:ABC-2 type transport system permease protein
MRKTWLIIQREYITRVRKKVFIITTLLAPIGLALITLMPLLLSRVSSEDQNIGVIDKSGFFKDQLQDDGSVHFINLDETYDSAKKNYKEAGLTGILYVSPQFNMYEGSGVEYFSDQQLGLRAQSTITKQMSKITRAIKLGKVDLTPQLIDELSKDVEIKAIVSSATGEKESNTGIATAIGYVMGFVIYIVMLLYGTMVMRGVMEEKTSRIAEVMVSSVKPFQLMMGKIIGIGMVGLTQFVIWIGLVVILNVGIAAFYGNELAQVQDNVTPAMGAEQIQQQTDGLGGMGKVLATASQLPWGYLISCFLFFFFGGYMLYAALFAAVGSAAGEEGDQSLTFLVTLPVIISIMIMINTLEQPNGNLAIVASLIPFSAPIVMVARLPFDPPAWQVVASMTSLVLGFIFTTWLAGKIYRTGILMYGKKVTLKELGKWLMYKN